VTLEEDKLKWARQVIELRAMCDRWRTRRPSAWTLRQYVCDPDWPAYETALVKIRELEDRLRAAALVDQVGCA